MTLLGINCGFGNTDVATLPQSAVDLESGWVDFPRPKTEIYRHIPLWPETLDSLRKAIEIRPEPKDKADAGLCFLTSQGRRWVRLQARKSDGIHLTKMEPLSQRFGRLLHRLKINGRPGLGFYALRHVFQTIGGEAKDPDATPSYTACGLVQREGEGGQGG